MKMKKPKKYNPLLVAFLALCVFGIQSAKAQPGSNTVVIQGKFTPTLDEAQKINNLPSIVDTVYPTPKFNYQIMEQKLNTPFSIVPLKPANLLGEPLDRLNAHYLVLAMGNYLSPFVEYSFNSTRDRNKRYGVRLMHHSAAGSITDYAFPAFSKNQVEVYGTKFLKKSSLSANVFYHRDVVHFYGFQPVDYPDSLLPADVDIVQRYNLVNASLQWNSLKSKKVNWNTSLNYYYWQDFYSKNENSIAAATSVDFPTDLIKSFGAQSIGFDISENFLNTSSNDSLSITQNLLSIRPFYKFNFGALDARIGFNTTVVTDSTSNLKFYPDIELQLNAIKDILRFTLSVKGYDQLNSMRQLTTENPFLGAVTPLEITSHKIVVDFGVLSSISKNFNLNIWANFSKMDQMPLYVTDTNSTYDNQFTIVYDEVEQIRFQVDMGYQMHQRLGVFLNSNYYIYTTTQQLYAWHLPTYDLNLGINYNIQNKIYFKLGLVNHGKMMVPTYVNGVMEPIEIKPWFDVNFGAEYRYGKHLGLFLNLNNIAAQRYYRYYNYPSFRFNFKAGLTYSF